MKKKKKKTPSNFVRKLAGRKLVWMVRNNPRTIKAQNSYEQKAAETLSTVKQVLHHLFFITDTERKWALNFFQKWGF